MSIVMAACGCRRGSVCVEEPAGSSEGDCTVSTDRLREPEREVRRRFREESSSSKGFGLVEQISAETARSRGSGDSEAWSMRVASGGCSAGPGVPETWA